MIKDVIIRWGQIRASPRGPQIGFWGSLPLTIAEIPRERLATQKLAVFSRFVPTNALASGDPYPGPAARFPPPCRLVVPMRMSRNYYFRIADEPGVDRHQKGLYRYKQAT
jgi:hypothetical protein